MAIGLTWPGDVPADARRDRAGCGTGEWRPPGRRRPGVTGELAPSGFWRGGQSASKSTEICPPHPARRIDSIEWAGKNFWHVQCSYEIARTSNATDRRRPAQGPRYRSRDPQGPRCRRHHDQGSRPHRIIRQKQQKGQTAKRRTEGFCRIRPVDQTSRGPNWAGPDGSRRPAGKGFGRDGMDRPGRIASIYQRLALWQSARAKTARAVRHRDESLGRRGPAGVRRPLSDRFARRG